MSHVDFVYEKRHVAWTFFSRPTPLKNVTHFFDFAGAPEAIFIVQALRSRAVYKSTLGARPGPDNEHTNIL